MAQEHRQAFDEPGRDAYRHGPVEFGGKATLSVEEVGEVLGIGRSLAYQGVRDGSIPSLRIGRRLVVPAVALSDLLTRGGWKS